MTKLANAHVVITGGSSGIGLETARLSLGKGARVSLLARRETQLEVARRDLTESVDDNTRVHVGVADVADRLATAAAITRAVDALGPCDVLICSAGYSHPGYFELLPPDVFHQQMAVNYHGTVHAVQAVVPSMLERGRGHVVLVSSTAGLVGVFGYSAYAPTKFAVRGLAESLRSELVPRGVWVSCVYPPDTETPGFAAENELKPLETAKVSAAIKPRAATDVAQAIVRGIEKDRFAISADPQTKLLVRLGSTLSPLVQASMDRTIRKVRGGGEAAG